ncbi:hypothetical protein FA13DRAFT_1742674 [Coprinellus micaceus]|uniref:Uncharacterized protein n=1 Tax=Coprinellus micaceus TaxID=71717 RepID=A0A4Y7SGD3_COPMI|nr:hypothetical protein FA13DRAFT_1742674 [Coprinellus micaceus]
MPLLGHLLIQHPDFLVGEPETDTTYWDDTQAISASFFACLHKGTQSICPRLMKIRIELSTISLNGLRTALETRAVLSAPHTAAPFARLQKVHVGLTETRPTFVPRDPGRTIDGTTLELAQCSLEEELKDSGVDAKIILRCHPDPYSSIYRPLNPRLGLPTDPWSNRL